MDSSKDLSRFTDEKLAIERPEPDYFDPKGGDIAEGVPNVLVRIQCGQPVGIRANVLEVTANHHGW